MDAKKRTKQHFDNTAADYNNSSDGRFVAPMYDVLLAELEKAPGGKVLDVGCGNGNLFRLLPAGRYELFGIDFSENMIEEAKKNCGDRAAFSVADAEDIPFDGSTFDLLICNASFHHYVHPDLVLTEMYRVLKDGGRLLLGDPYVPGVMRPLMNALTRYSSKGDYHFYGLNEMKKLLAQNGLALLSSNRTRTHTAFYVAEKRGPGHEERATDRWE